MPHWHRIMPENRFVVRANRFYRKQSASCRLMHSTVTGKLRGNAGWLLHFGRKLSPQSSGAWIRLKWRSCLQGTESLFYSESGRFHSDGVTRESSWGSLLQNLNWLHYWSWTQEKFSTDRQFLSSYRKPLGQGWPN